MGKLRAACVIVGDAAVGKSSLSQMFRSDGAVFQKNYTMSEAGAQVSPVGFLSCEAPTPMKHLKQPIKIFSIKHLRQNVGVELLEKSVSIPETSDSVELYIYDSAGREPFAAACESIWGQPSVVCVVFDVTSEASFISCSQWIERVRSHCDGLQVPGVLVGNKCDLSSRRAVEAADARAWAQSHGLQYHETSAKEIGQYEAPFLSLAQMFYSLYQDQIHIIQSLI